MDVRDYCTSMQHELTGWKAKLYDVARKFEKMPFGDKGKVSPVVNELHTILAELEERIGRLQTECPKEWEPDKVAIERKIEQLKTKWERVWGDLYLGAP